ncbi:MAG: glycosyltransferase family 4 protein [Syntrophomonadaceae bacterium]|nr:glycosyltransferase family 4 protein [Syntrophomonadaceae bacterium]
MNRILHVIAQKPGYTGSGIYLQGLMDEAAKKSYAQALVAGFSQYDILDDFYFPSDLEVFPVFFEGEDLPFPVVGMSDVMPYVSTRYRDLTPAMYLLWKESFTKAIKEALVRFKPEVIFTHHLWLLSALVKELAGRVPVIAFSHGTDLRQLVLAPQYAEIAKVACSKIDKVVALNAWQAEEIASVYNIARDDLMVGGVGFNPAIFYPPLERRKNNLVKLIYAGKLSYAKGVKSLLAACEMLYKDVPDFELLLLGSGDGNEKDDLMSMMEECSFSLSALGAVSQKELGEVFRQGDIFVLPSFYEGLPLVVLEALASGLRVVVSDLSGLKPWLGDLINESGLITFVSLPNLLYLDQPVAEELGSFERDLKEAILFQMNQLFLSGSQFSKEIEQAISRFSWAGLFKGLENLFLSL